MNFKIDIDGAERQIEAAADGSLVIDGETFKARVTASAGNKRTVQVGDKTYEVTVVKRGSVEEGAPSEYVLEVVGERVRVTVEDVTKESPQTGAAAPVAAAAAAPQGAATQEYKDGIFAPVPGKIADIKVKVGDTVKEGDLVLILEAMKMENELHSPKQAVIAAVLVNKGDQATKGQLLVAFG